MRNRRCGKRVALVAAVKRALKAGAPVVGVYVASEADQTFWMEHLTDKELKRIVYVAPHKSEEP